MADDNNSMWETADAVVSLLAVLAAIAAGVAVGAVTESANLSVFWALAASYAVRTVGHAPGSLPDDFTLPRRTAVAAWTIGASSLALALGLERWARGWETIMVALVVAAAAHAFGIVVVAPTAARRRALSAVVRPGDRFEWYPGDIRPATLALISALALGAGGVALMVTEGAAWNAAIGLWSALFTVTLAVGLWGRGHMGPGAGGGRA